MAQSESEFEQRIIVVGVGLIGGSVAAAVRQRFAGAEVVGIGRSEERLAAALDAGLLTSFAIGLTAEMLASRCTVVICLPVDMIADQVKQVAALAGADVLITDAGSVKGSISTDVAGNDAANSLFVGAHPIAGGEQGGFENSDPNLFDEKVCIVVPNGNESLTDRACRFWQSIGCRVSRMSAAEHDRKLAVSSHLPHLMAAVTATVTGAANLPLTGSGFRDTTRIAAGDPALWRSILAANRSEVVAAIGEAQLVLDQYRSLLTEQDDESIEQLLADAARCRNLLNCCDTIPDQITSR